MRTSVGNQEFPSWSKACHDDQLVEGGASHPIPQVEVVSGFVLKIKNGLEHGVL